MSAILAAARDATPWPDVVALVAMLLFLLGVLWMADR